MDANRVTHLEFIQDIVTRLAGNSFLLKGWSLTLVAGLFALAAKDANQSYLAIAFLPTFFFWGLDAYYLRLERLFRELYDASRQPESAIPLFSMDTHPVEDRVSGWFCTLFRPAVLWFHGPVVATVLVVLLIAANTGGQTWPFTHVGN